MVMSEDFEFEDDETAFIEAATQVETSRDAVEAFDLSPRPFKRRRGDPDVAQLDGADSRDNRQARSKAPQRSNGTSSSRRKTRKPVQQLSDASDDGLDPEYYFPGELGEENPAKKSRHLIHIPKNPEPLEDLYLTQTQPDLDSSPSRIRGAVWKKPSNTHSTIQPHKLNGLGTGIGISKVPTQQVTLERQPLRPIACDKVANYGNAQSFRPASKSFDEDAALAARMQAEEDKIAGSYRNAGNTKTVDLSLELADLPSDAFSSSSPDKSPPKPVVVTSQVPRNGLRGPQIGLRQMTIYGSAATQELTTSQAAKKKHAWPLKSRDEPPTHHTLNNWNMGTWVYPTNLGTIRDYQFSIVSRSLYHNTLVALPTGLGKTFIAATVMLNYYRWTIDAQIVFMAPTKPLIAQQMEACFQIVGIPRKDTVVMTGDTTPAARADEWSDKRVFFMTPQTVLNDLKTGICDPRKVVCIVVDEAHKATGGYAYTEVVAFLRRFNPSFRVLALTATPGASIEAVQSVVDSLGIARVELRTEDSIDIRPYTHEKLTEAEHFDYSDEQNLIMELLSKAIKPVLNRLNQQNAYWSKDPMQLSAFGLTLARKRWMASDAARKAPMSLKGMINSIFTCLSSLGHGIGLLKFHGIVPFYNSAKTFQENATSGEVRGNKYARQIVEHDDWVKMMTFIRGWTSDPDFIGHPKLQYLREVVLNHFLDANEGRRRNTSTPSAATRIMVFSGFRDSTEEICRVLKRNDPMVRPHVFVGQQASKESDGMNQKRQNEVIQDFKSGKFNTLVATSIGEEGLDIGDVDLIVCYDASSSPIRMLQRIGRTGRKRVGRVCLLLMKGKEENDYAKAKDNYAYIQKSIADPSKYNYRDDQSPRILPKTVQPVVDKRMIDIPIENTQPVDLNEKGRRGRGKGKQKRPPKKFHMPDGVRTGFVKASRFESNSEDASDAELTPKPRTAKKAQVTSKKRAATSVPEPVQLPFLEDVLLNETQQKDLERRYATTADYDDDITVSAPDTSRYPDALRLLGKTKYLCNGRVTKRAAKALQAIHTVTDETIQRWQKLLDQVTEPHDRLADARLVSPRVSDRDSNRNLPEIPRSISKVRKAPTRPQKKATRPKSSYGSGAEEGDESEPEPTPANMRIGTQGIDLGSCDTSGEDEGEGVDSELEDFIVRSDQPIEMLSSSQSGTQQIARKRRGLKRRVNAAALEIFSEEDEYDFDDRDNKINRRRRVVSDSEGESDHLLP